MPTDKLVPPCELVPTSFTDSLYSGSKSRGYHQITNARNDAGKVTGGTKHNGQGNGQGANQGSGQEDSDAGRLLHA